MSAARGNGINLEMGMTMNAAHGNSANPCRRRQILPLREITLIFELGGYAHGLGDRGFTVQHIMRGMALQGFPRHLLAGKA